MACGFPSLDSAYKEGVLPPALLKTVDRVHTDDIHGIKYAAGRIITGSKDATVKSFAADGTFVSYLSNPPLHRGTYRAWVTALDVFSDGGWVHGSRNGFLGHGTREGRRNFGILFPKIVEETGLVAERCYKARNSKRITGLHCIIDSRGKKSAFVGFPERFFQFDLSSCTILRSHNFEAPEWVYGFSLLGPSALAVIHGSALSIFASSGDSFEEVAVHVKRKEKGADGKTEFVSAVSKMKEVNKYALAYFGGATEVRDSETGEVVHSARGHFDRVWQAVPKSAFEYLSCADDRLIKVWDIREKKAVHTFDGHPGRVSALDFTGETTFVAGTCPDDPHSSETKGQLFFYDLRKAK